MNNNNSTTETGDRSSALVYLRVQHLKLHPQNLRRFYVPQAIAKMAESIRAAGGVYQALLVVADPDQPETYLVIDGNMRLAAGRSLGEACPLLKCEVIEAGHAEQLLAMAITTEFHFPKDPVSQGLHYRRLMDEEGFTITAIIGQTGISRPTIDKALKTLELEPEIQQMIVEGKISPDLRVTRALLGLPGSEIRLRLARRFAYHETGIKAILRACRFTTEQAARLSDPGAVQQLADQVAQKRQAVARILESRNQVARRGPRLDLAAIELLHRAAEVSLCEGCKLSGLTDECFLCPGPRDFVNAVIELIETPADLEVPTISGNGHHQTEAKRLAALGSRLREDFRRAA